jgi:hypothetical protein
MSMIEHDQSPSSSENSLEIERIARRLDEDHLPETNGRMAICRRCGNSTDGPEGGHAPLGRQLERAQRWLDAQALGSSIARLKSGRNT